MTAKKWMLVIGYYLFWAAIAAAGLAAILYGLVGGSGLTS